MQFNNARDFNIESVTADAFAALNGVVQSAIEPDCREGLEVLLRSIRHQASLHASGRAMVYGEIVRLLRNRLLFQQWQSQRPLPPESAIRKPIFIVGLPRTGTTLLQNLLALDVRADSLREWQANDPIPPKGFNAELDLLRRNRAQAKWESLIRANPTINTIHDGAADSVAECQTLMAHDFKSFHFPCMFWVPDYVEWLNSCDMASSYHVHRQLLLAAQTYSPQTAWVLKSPSHLFSLPYLLDSYPDADVIVTHRDPAKAIPSFISLIANYHCLFSADMQVQRLANWCLEQLGLGLDRLCVFRDRPSNRSFYDVYYQDLLRDPINVVKEIYRKQNRIITREFENAMLDWLQKNPQNKYGAHNYSNYAQFLAHPNNVRRFDAYLQRFSVPRES